MWEKSFVATSVLLGASVEDARAMVAPASAESAAMVAGLVEKLGDARRAVRAQALAVAAQEIVARVDEVTLR